MIEDTAVILAAGYGTRLSRVVCDAPKPMALINQKPFLFYLLNNIKGFGVKNFVICVSHLKNVVKEYFNNGEELGINISYSEETEPSGTAGALAAARKKIKGPFFCFNGDTYLEADLKELKKFHQEKKSLATVCLTSIADIYDKGHIKFDDDFKITSFSEKKPIHKKGWINGGVYYFDQKIFAHFPKVIKKDLIKQKEYSLEYHVFPHIIKHNLPFYAFEAKGSFIDIGTPSEYQRAKGLFK